jgi:hypothetical protein
MNAPLCVLQNADDNKYSSAAASCPMLELVLTPGAVSLLNNERGFSVRDVRGISDIGKSKKKGKAGCTGAAGTQLLRMQGCIDMACQQTRKEQLSTPGSPHVMVQPMTRPP